MAIVKFQQEASVDFTSFNNFLQQNKEGTFLENATITFSSEATDTLTISDGSASVELKLYSSLNNSTNYIVKLTGSTITNGLTAATYTSGYVKIVGALLCSKGLIVQCQSLYSSAYLYNVYFILTVDSNGKLAIIYPITGRDTELPYSMKSTYVLTYDSTQILNFSTNPNYSANITSIAPIATITIDNNSYLPFAYAAIATQQPSNGLQAVKNDNDNYITNSVWYIKDGA